MKCYGLTPSQLAEKTGIQRASVSHILSGRNKPSLEVMQKIYEAFPELDLKWLMTGVGDEPVAGAKESVGAPGVVENNLFSQPIQQPEPRVVQPLQNVVVQAPEQPLLRVARQQVSQKGVTERQSRRPVAARQPQNLSDRRIKEIRIFYTDGTYETLFPEK